MGRWMGLHQLFQKDPKGAVLVFFWSDGILPNIFTNLGLPALMALPDLEGSNMAQGMAQLKAF